MKHYCQLWSFSALFLLVSFTACKKDSSSGTSTNSSTATVSGAAFQSTVAAGVDFTSQNNLTVEFFQIKGHDSTNITISFPDTLQANKAYTIGGTNTLVSLQYETPQDWYSTWDGQASGSLTLTSFNKNGHNVQGI